MIDIKPKILQALESNQALISLVGHDKDGETRIYQVTAPYADDFPRITFFEMDNVDNRFADDTAIASEIRIQIDVWSKGSTSKIANEVDKTMKSLGFRRTASTDLYEDDTKVFHKGMRYKTNQMIEEE
ncbi:hypothetical protein AM501_27305 [Aneurinibacillus migulanus]|uniref:tail completion protein gp17 n=1 Tax=Aneurinibacillus migulanus TaxID=47500 RepID=UPI0005B9F8EC|nr:DUF3168 domain-containing protein [Aneurinibacillus migulanus]KIV56946.1 phage protein [Aneurinibacillus migulanus]KPD05273.1 hypothetical protein AM501_27305 [Aneurinibacillus migulanus]MCP1355467.1 DUF3168 domain-containing protein [Aneurinibacillus migulanus]CEH28860.1 Uncharacterized protein BN1090_A2_01284 [Aneurinibacillus migulanus]